MCRLSFAEGREALEERFPAADLVEGGEEFSALLKQVVAAVEAPVNGFDHIPIDVKGTAFQEAVWRELRKIPGGRDAQLFRYRRRGRQTEGGARGGQRQWREQCCGADSVPPRACAATARLGGYAYGLPIKEELLKREGC